MTAARPDPAAAALDPAGRCAGTAGPAAATTGPPEYGRLDRILANAAEAAEPGGDRALLESPLNDCWASDGCIGQHRFDVHSAIEEAVNEPLTAGQVDRIVMAVTTPLAALRAMVVALEAECAALTDALGDPNVTHPFAPMQGVSVICGADKDEDSYCALPSTAAVHRTPARVRAELEER